jgi:hypothetical protein
MTLTKDEIHDIACKTAEEVLEGIERYREQILQSNLLIGHVIGYGAIPVGGRENKKLPCHGCRIDSNKPFEPGNAMLNTEGAIGILNKEEARDWCSELVEEKDGRCARAQRIGEAARVCKTKFPNDSRKYFECFIPEFKNATKQAVAKAKDGSSYDYFLSILKSSGNASCSNHGILTTATKSHTSSEYGISSHASGTGLLMGGYYVKTAEEAARILALSCA